MKHLISLIFAVVLITACIPAETEFNPKPTIALFGGGYCDSNFVGKDLYDVYPILFSQPWKKVNNNNLSLALSQRGIKFGGPGIIVFLGGPACPFTECSWLGSIGDSRKKYYALSDYMPHFLDSYGGPFPVTTAYNGTIIAQQIGCQYKKEAPRLGAIKAAQAGAMLINLSGVDLSTYPPGKYWVRYGVNGYGSPSDDQDAQIEISHATCDVN